MWGRDWTCLQHPHRWTLFLGAPPRDPFCSSSFPQKFKLSCRPPRCSSFGYEQNCAESVLVDRVAVCQVAAGDPTETAAVFVGILAESANPGAVMGAPAAEMRGSECPSSDPGGRKRLVMRNSGAVAEGRCPRGWVWWEGARGWRRPGGHACDSWLICAQCHTSESLS